MDLETVVKSLGGALAVVSVLADTNPDDEELAAAKQGVTDAYLTLSGRRQAELTARHLADLRRRSDSELAPRDLDWERARR